MFDRLFSRRELLRLIGVGAAGGVGAALAPQQAEEAGAAGGAPEDMPGVSLIAVAGEDLEPGQLVLLDRDRVWRAGDPEDDHGLHVRVINYD